MRCSHSLISAAKHASGSVSDRDRRRIIGCLDLVAVEIFSETRNHSAAVLTLQCSSAAPTEVPNDSSAAVKLLISVVVEPLFYQGRDAPLLGAPDCVDGFHDVSGGQRRTFDGRGGY
jgi:hypothetical protein